jgi:hypothetical protein
LSKVLGRINKWRSKILGLSGLAQVDAAGLPSAALTASQTVNPGQTATIRGVGTAAAAMGPGQGPMSGRQAACEAAVAKAYRLSCSMDARATYFGLTLQGLLQLCHDTQLFDDK